MAKLTSKKRRHLKKSQFAKPGKRKYPINDPSHAKNALARVSQYGTPAEKATIRRKVHAKYPNINVSGMNKSSAKKKHYRKSHSGKRVG